MKYNAAVKSSVHCKHYGQIYVCMVAHWWVGSMCNTLCMVGTGQWASTIWASLTDHQVSSVVGPGDLNKYKDDF